jgi:hypothetical protein
MPAPHDRRRPRDRRALLDRRLAAERAHRHADDDRRGVGERRSGQERRLAILSAEDQIRDALRLLTRVIETGHTPEKDQRSLEGAMLRLRYALDRLED